MKLAVRAFSLVARGPPVGANESSCHMTITAGAPVASAWSKAASSQARLAAPRLPVAPLGPGSSMVAKTIPSFVKRAFSGNPAWRVTAKVWAPSVWFVGKKVLRTMARRLAVSSAQSVVSLSPGV